MVSRFLRMFLTSEYHIIRPETDIIVCHILAATLDTLNPVDANDLTNSSSNVVPAGRIR